jgi:GNAT superfamily N-acetyltransferase
MSEPTDILIRIAREGDGDGLAQSWIETGAYYADLHPDLYQIPTAEGLAASLEQWATGSQSEVHLVLVAETDNQVVGAVGATYHEPAADVPQFQFVRDFAQSRIIIDLLYVRPVYWRRGIGKRLLGAAEAWGKDKGATMSLLETAIDSPVSVPFYEQGMFYQRRGLWLRKLLN